MTVTGLVTVQDPSAWGIPRASDIVAIVYGVSGPHISDSSICSRDFEWNEVQSFVVGIDLYAFRQVLLPTRHLKARSCAEPEVASMQGVIPYGLTFALQSWVAFESGPVLLASYKPLQSFATIGMSYVFLGDNIHLGR